MTTVEFSQNELEKILHEVPLAELGTIDAEGKPHVFQTHFLYKDGKFLLSVPVVFPQVLNDIRNASNQVTLTITASPPRQASSSPDHSTTKVSETRESEPTPVFRLVIEGKAQLDDANLDAWLNYLPELIKKDPSLGILSALKETFAVYWKQAIVTISPRSIFVYSSARNAAN